eukprot:9872558-Alexandrium_andersonii.AAC.1
MADALANASGSELPQVVPESPAAHDPQANGSVENAVTQLQGMAPALMLAPQSQIEGDIPVDHPVMLWLIERAG